MDTPAPVATTARVATPPLRTDRAEWNRKTQSSSYIRKVKVLSALLQAYGPARRTPTAKETRDDASLTQAYSKAARAEAIHYFLVPMTDERRGARR